MWMLKIFYTDFSHQIKFFGEHRLTNIDFNPFKKTLNVEWDNYSHNEYTKVLNYELTYQEVRNGSRN